MTDFVIIQSGDQVKAQSEAAAAIAVAFGDNAKDFQIANHVLDRACKADCVTAFLQIRSQLLLKLDGEAVDRLFPVLKSARVHFSAAACVAK